MELLKTLSLCLLYFISPTSAFMRTMKSSCSDAPTGGLFHTNRNMAPKYDPETSRWAPSSPEEEASAGYSAFGSLIRQGPSPFIQRLTNPDEYDQGVLKMMEKDNMSRDEAQGNMDAYIRNPNDWVIILKNSCACGMWVFSHFQIMNSPFLQALQKMEEKKGAVKFDYAKANMNTGDLILTAGWSTIILAFVSRVAYVYTAGCDSFCQQYNF